LNPQPTDYKSVALPIELHQLTTYEYIYHKIFIIVKYFLVYYI